MTRTITALYDSRDEAEAARSQLTSMGIEPSSVQITASEGGGSMSSSDGGGQHRGFFAGLKDFFMPQEDAHAYHEGVSRGGCLLTARVDESRADDVCRILENSGAVDFDARQQQWREAGWSPEARFSGTEARDETIPVVEEQLRVGKREVERGGVRVRSYVEETPVQEEVNLREEHVELERRPVNEPLRSADADNLFQERSIELTERAEEPVVAKEAFVREEIGIRKDVDQRTESISDTVRHTEVDVDDSRGGMRQSQGPGGQSQTFGERASFASDNDDDTSIAMDPEHGSTVHETEEERRQRLARQGGTDTPRGF
jgi:uncharacterized protein (TIGR02271 family)